MTNFCKISSLIRFFKNKPLFLTMKLSFILIVIASLNVYANAFSQKISLNSDIKDMSIKEVLKSLETQSGYRFFYSDDFNVLDKKVSLNAQDADIKTILKQVFHNTPASVEYMEGNIVIITPFARQGITVTGTIVDEGGNPVPGANIIVKGSTQGVTSDINGRYSITVPGESSVLMFSFIGYETQEIQVADKRTIDVPLREQSTEITEVVVTALGITRETKALGYAVQQVDGASLNEAKESNFMSNLSGKVAGVNIISNSPVGGSARMIIRGESSLNYFGNQPLFVVDGVPTGNSPISNTGDADYGNSAGEINPADIESVNILKGPAASALYGSRAANGVVLITTKSGRGAKKGVGVSVNFGSTWENPLRLPKFQNDFGGGSNGQYEGGNFGYSNGGLYADGIEDTYDESWGPRFDPTVMKKQYDSPTTNGFRGGDVYLPNRGEIIPTPWVAQPDNMKDFFETGHTYNTNVALSGNTDKATFRASYTNVNQTGIVPNNDLKRNTVSVNTSFKLTNQFTASVSGSYVNSQSTNRPDLGYGRNRPMYLFVWMPRNISTKSMRNYWQPGMEGIQQFQYNYGEGHNNIYFYQNENTNGQNKNEVYGNVKLEYKILPNLIVMARAGTNFYDDFRPSKLAFSSTGDTGGDTNAYGRYSEYRQKFQENNFDFLITYTNHLGDFNYGVNFGSNRMDQHYRSATQIAPQLLIPGIYNIGNSRVATRTSAYEWDKRINSVYAMLQLDYKRKVFLDLTGRNDWSSALTGQADWENNNSYFYPSVSTSILFDQIFDMPAIFDLAKLRFGYAQVGNDTSPYQLATIYNYGQLWDGTPSLNESQDQKNKNLKPERSYTYEIGAELMLFRNRLGLDVTYYDIKSKDQILSLESAISSGYKTRMVNAGEIQNRGIEIMFRAVPLQFANSLTWNLNVNFAKNTSKVIKLASGINNITQSAPGEDARIEARVGERMGALYGPGFERVASGDMKGQVIIGSNGRPLITADNIYLGNINPDYTIGITNRVSFKGAYIEALLDIRQGGVFVSRFLNKAAGAGQTIETAEGRSARTPGTEYDDNKPYYRDGAADMGNGNYQPNLTIFDGTLSQGVYGCGIRDYHKRYYDHNSEAQLMDASFVKLRELKIGYQIPSSVLQNFFIQNITVSLVGRNLFLWTKNQHVDPETGASTGSGLVGGFEDLSLPSTRSLGFNISVNF